LAIILYALSRYHQEFTITVIDDVLENITLGLELNDFRFHQRRVAEVKYLAELYVYRMIDSSIIFDTMFKILTFGHGKFYYISTFALSNRVQGVFQNLINILNWINQTTFSVYD